MALSRVVTLLAVAVTVTVAGGVMVARAALPQQAGSVDLLSQANVQIDGAVAGDQAGVSVAGAGDVNGDGIADVIVGARLADNNGRANSGSAYVIFGEASPTRVDLADLGSRGFRIDGAAAGDQAGVSVAGAGDVNGDGRPDVIVGAEDAAENSRAFSGSVYVVFGKGSTAPVDLASLGGQGFRIDGAVAGDEAGISVAGAGDVNGDGRSDVIIGAFGAGNNARGDSGSAYVIFGKASAAPVDLASLGGQGFRIDGAVAGDEAGTSVAGAGDVNGDGRPDVVVGAHQAGNNSRAFSGSAYVVFGKASATTVDLSSLGAQGFRIDGAAPGDGAGFSVAGAGDVNGDGIGDVILGAEGASNNGRTSSGSAYVVFGKASTTTIDLGALGGQGFRIDGALSGDEAGFAVAGAGDVNGDGHPDVIVGAFFASNNSRSFSGSAYVVFGKGSTTPIDLGALGGEGFRIDGAASLDFVGGAVAGAGDVNDDGRPDVILGAEVADNNGRANSGSAYELYGFGTPALSYPGRVTATIGQPITALSPAVKRTGTASFAVFPPLPGGLSLDPSTGTVSGTPTQAEAPTVHTVTMTDLAGSATASLQVTVNAAPDRTAPTISGLTISPRRFAVSRAATAVSARVRRGALLRYTLSEIATATITIRRAIPGRRSGAACAPPSRRLRRAKRCTRFVKVGILTRANQPAGNQSITFSGRIGRRALPPARYRATIVATDAAGNRSKPSTVGFEIVRR